MSKGCQDDELRRKLREANQHVLPIPFTECPDNACGIVQRCSQYIEWTLASSTGHEDERDETQGASHPSQVENVGPLTGTYWNRVPNVRQGHTRWIAWITTASTLHDKDDSTRQVDYIDCKAGALRSDVKSTSQIPANSKRASRTKSQVERM